MLETPHNPNAKAEFWFFLLELLVLVIGEFKQSNAGFFVVDFPILDRVYKLISDKYIL